MAQETPKTALDRQDLRRIAREAADGRPPNVRQLSTGDVEHLIHELGVYQNELLAQNVELLEARTELEKTRDRYRTLYESAPLGYLTLRPNGLITEANLPGCELLNTNRATLVGKNLTSFVVTGERDAFQKFLRDTAGHEGARAAEFEVAPAKRAPVHLHIETRHAAAEDGGAILATLTDISARKRLEEQLREANAAKSQFLDHMSHEIRTPLGGVLGMAEILEHTALTFEQRECVDAIRRAGKLLLGIVNDVLDLSRIESRGVSLERTAFALRALVDDTVHLLAESAQTKNLELCCRVGDDVPEEVLGDPGRVRQILFNVVGNAIKFTQQGQVVVQAVREEADGDSASLRVTVEDTGVGIPETARNSLFEVFQQGDPSMARRFGGSGIGLAISRRLLEAMSGQIGFHSQVGVGSKFWFRLPFPVLKAAPDKRLLFRGMRALVVQEASTSRAYLVEQLQRLGIEAEAADIGEDGRRAAARTASRPFDLAFVDLDLPCGDGRELARELRRRSGTAVFMLAPFTERGLLAGCSEDGGAYLLKPVREADVEARVRTALAHARHVPDGEAPFATELPPSPETRGKVLVAEDDPVNQRVMTHFLGMLGQEADIVMDGAAAAEAALSRPYDLLFMDWQMPRMDGAEATREIRRREARGRRVPIVAVTAHALEEYREAALAAGVNEVLTKPVALKDLATVLERWGTRPASTNAEPSAQALLDPDAPPATGKDMGRVAERLDQLLQRLPADQAWGFVDLVLELIPKSIADLRQAVATSDPHGLAQLAHRLRGTLFQIGPQRMIELAGLLERLGEARHFDGIDAVLEELQTEADRLRTFLEEEKGKAFRGS